MKFEIDRDNNIAYLKLTDLPDEDIQVAHTESVFDGELMIDLDADGAVLGFEFLNARTQLAALEHDLGRPLPPDYWETAQ